MCDEGETGAATKTTRNFLCDSPETGTAQLRRHARFGWGTARLLPRRSV